MWNTNRTGMCPAVSTSRSWAIGIIRATAGLAAITVVAIIGVRGWHQPPKDTILVSGDIEAHESVLSFKTVRSRIVELPVDEGQLLTAGTMLARLEDDDYRQQVIVDETLLLVQQGRLAFALRSLEAADRILAGDRAELLSRTTDEQRMRVLWERSVISGQTRDLSRTRSAEAQALLLRDQALRAAAQESVSVARARIKNAEATLVQAKIIRGYTVLRAPFSGVVLVRNAELGEEMLPGTPVLTLADLDHLWMRAYVNETDVGRLRLGEVALVTIDSYPGHNYVGRLSAIADRAEFTPRGVETHAERVTLVYRIKIEIENHSHELKPGMPADAVIECRQPGMS